MSEVTFFERRTSILTGARNCVTELAGELAEMDEFSRMGVKQENSDGEEDGACGWSKDMSREFKSAREARERLRESAVRMARDAGMTPSSAAFRAIDILDVNNNGGAQQTVATAASVKTPKYSGRSDWEAFHA